MTSKNVTLKPCLTCTLLMGAGDMVWNEINNHRCSKDICFQAELIYHQGYLVLLLMSKEAHQRAQTYFIDFIDAQFRGRLKADI